LPRVLTRGFEVRETTGFSEFMKMISILFALAKADQDFILFNFG
jgi:hypothetical protein